MRIPFLLLPVGKDYLWGGSRLKTEFAKDLAQTPLAETWECSTHPDGVCLVGSGPYKGQLLTGVLQEHPDWVGTHPVVRNGQLPILVKLIDAAKDLSIQVHPSDEYAFIHEGGSLGKTEMWYVLDATPNAQLIYGFCRQIDKVTFQQSLKEGSILKYLQKIPVHKNDVFYIQPGCIHAIGGGVVLAEIQESSNITYRLYDYERLDKNNKLRPLHIEKALDVIDFQEAKKPAQPMRVLSYKVGMASELLCRCKYFQVKRIILNVILKTKALKYKTGTNSFEILLCTEGKGMLQNADFTLPFRRGDCIFVPAQSAKCMLSGQAQLLQITC